MLLDDVPTNQGYCHIRMCHRLHNVTCLLPDFKCQKVVGLAGNKAHKLVTTVRVCVLTPESKKNTEYF